MLNPSMVMSADISGRGGGCHPPPLNLNHCLSDLILIVHLQTLPRSEQQVRTTFESLDKMAGKSHI